MTEAGVMGRAVPGALALDLAQRAAASPHPLVFIDATADRLAELASAAASFVPGLRVLVLPPVDSLPYDVSAPSVAVSGQRRAAMAAVAAQGGGSLLLLTSARAVLNPVPPPGQWHAAQLVLRPGDACDPAMLCERLAALGYQRDEHVDEPGQVAPHLHVIDLFPGDATAPVRLTLAEGRIAAIHAVNLASHRSAGRDLRRVTLHPVTEPPAAESRACLLAALPGAAILLHADVRARWQELRDMTRDAYAVRLRSGRSQPGSIPLPDTLMVPEPELEQLLAEGGALHDPALGLAEPVAALHGLSALTAALRKALPDGPVAVAVGPAASRVRAALSARLDGPVQLAASWDDAASAPPGTVSLLRTPLEAGFRRAGLLLLAAPPHARRAARANPFALEEPPAVGDIVVHRGYGVCRLAGLTDAGTEERLKLEFAGDTELLVQVGDLADIWRYGSGAKPIALDRVDGVAWRRRESEIAGEIVATAKEMAVAAAARAAKHAPVLVPPAAPFARFVQRFGFTLSPDQADAAAAVLSDMRSGRPMDRLVCGDVGFGKTEIALRAAAAAALAGDQVAVAAPTTVLARQHLLQFGRRFAGLGVTVAGLMDGTPEPERRAVLAGLADGSIGVVVGTGAVAGAQVRFRNLALVVVDEEQRFGDEQKRRLTGMSGPEGAVHALVMTATPIPRTLQTAMIGLRDVSVILTAPQRRRAPRTFTLEWDDVVVREALMREHARGGQSFVVCPRIEEIGALGNRLEELVPELSLKVAHGRLTADTLAETMAAFTEGEGDVLLATNIIEAGLDIPRANTMMVVGPDKFGLAQLHQMRGRVGRSPRSSFAYFLTEPGRTLPDATRHRLHVLETQGQLGAGMAIAMADMDTRGAGELFGDRQAGHVHAIGTELYQFLLAAHLAASRGERGPPVTPHLHVELEARIPVDMVADEGLRLELYRRLARVTSPHEADELAEELADRFGELPPAMQHLLDLAHLRGWCAAHAVVQVDAGPQAIALTAESPADAAAVVAAIAKAATLRRARVIVPIAERDPVARLRALLAILP